jgi:predicted RNase H-like HicB family nuclease
MKTQRFTVLIERGEDGYLIGTVPALKGCFTQGRTVEELLPRVREVIALCLETQEPVALDLVGVQQVDVPVTLRKKKGPTRARKVRKAMS